MITQRPLTVLVALLTFVGIVLLCGVMIGSSAAQVTDMTESRVEQYEKILEETP